MDKRQFFIEGIQADTYKRKDWVLSLFAVTKLPDHNPDKCYPYQLVKSNMRDSNYYCVDPSDTTQLIQLVGTNVTNPLFAIDEPVRFKPNDLKNVKEEIVTTYSAAIINAYVLIYAFGSKIPYMHDMRKGDKLDHLIVSLAKEYPPDFLSQDEQYLADCIAKLDPNDPNIYVHELKKYSFALAALPGFSTIAAPAGNTKTMSVNPEIIKRRDVLLQENEGKLHDPVVMANIINELATMDMKDFEGDPANGFFIKDKSFFVSRMKAHILYGIEYGMDKTSLTPTVIKTSLSEGIRVTDLPALVDSSRAASYDRGNQTALAGAGVKEIYRALQNVTVAKSDCDTKLGLLLPIESTNIDELVGRYSVDLGGGKSSLITKEWLTKNIGKNVIVRSPMYCKSPGMSYCPQCIGEAYSKSPTGLHIAGSDILSIFMNDSMKAMHGKVLSTKVLDINSVFS